MSPLPWTVQLPPLTNWLPGGTPGPPTSAQDQPVGHTPGGGVGHRGQRQVVEDHRRRGPVDPAGGGQAGQVGAEPKGSTWVEPSSGVQVTPSVEVNVDRSVWAGLNRVSCQATMRR